MGFDLDEESWTKSRGCDRLSNIPGKLEILIGETKTAANAAGDVAEPFLLGELEQWRIIPSQTLIFGGVDLKLSNMSLDSVQLWATEDETAIRRVRNRPVPSETHFVLFGTGVQDLKLQNFACIASRWILWYQR